MPNWCENSLKISGNQTDLARFKAKAFRAPSDPKQNDIVSHLSFENFLPNPNPDQWYEWNNQKWGTKWDAEDVSEPEQHGNNLTYYFDTAWSPPIAFCKAVSTMYPDLVFYLEYEEGGCCFSGEYEVRNGVVFTDDYRDEMRNGEDNEEYNDDENREPNRFCEECFFATPNITENGKIDCQQCGYKES